MFNPDLFDDNYIFSVTKFEGTELTQLQWEYNKTLDYLNFIAQQEGLQSINFINEQRNVLYSRNNVPNLLKENPQLLNSPIHRIPLITHKIWITSNDTPKVLPYEYIKWYESSIEHNPLSAGWVHYFWIENKEKQALLYNVLKNHASIKIMELDSLDFVTGNLYKTIIKNKKSGYLGQAADIIRIELLNKFGGFYFDTDYKIFHPLEPYSKLYDLIMGLDPMSPFLSNAFMACKPKHPFLSKALALIQRNYSEQSPYYIKRDTQLKYGLNTLVLTGPCMVTVAFAASAGQNDNVDIVMPPQILLPMSTNDYPTLDSLKLNDPIPPQAIGAHYWHRTWTDPRYEG